MQNATIWFRAGLGMQVLLAGLVIVLAVIYYRKDSRGRMLLLARLLSWGMAAVIAVNVVMIAGLLFTMQQFGLSHSRLFVVNLVVIGLMSVLKWLCYWVSVFVTDNCWGWQSAEIDR